jgi:hypothetical protein
LCPSFAPNSCSRAGEVDRNLSVLAFKAFLAFGTTSASSLGCDASILEDPTLAASSLAGSTAAANKTKAHGLTSGTYTFWYDVADGMVAQPQSMAVSSIRACLAACDNRAFCAAAAMRLRAAVDAATAARGDADVASCSLIFGNTTPSPKRSLTKADVNLLTLQATA